MRQSQVSLNLVSFLRLDYETELRLKMINEFI